MRGEAICPYCKRKVTTFDPGDGPVMFGHRVKKIHTPETPWCKGGGRKP